MINDPQVRCANYLRFTPREGKAEALATYLTPDPSRLAAATSGASFWFALRAEADDQQFGIFDVFAHERAREGYVSGKGVAGLRERSAELIEGGWKQGVLANGARFDVLGSVVPEHPTAISLITYIPLVATPGKSEALESLLSAGPARVAREEPKTIHWYALRDVHRESHYAILDLYADRDGLEQHLAGDVAATLRAHAPELVVGGWKGVVSNAINYEVIAQAASR